MNKIEAANKACEMLSEVERLLAGCEQYQFAARVRDIRDGIESIPVRELGGDAFFGNNKP